MRLKFGVKKCVQVPVFTASSTMPGTLKMDRHTKEQQLRNMQAIGGKGSKIECALALALFARGYRYRKNNASVFGKPDLIFKRWRQAKYVDSEFWHGKDWPLSTAAHKSNTDYWHQKIERKMAGDRLVNTTLRKAGWKVLRFWGEKVVNKLDRCISKIERALDEQRRTLSPE